MTNNEITLNKVDDTMKSLYDTKLYKHYIKELNEMFQFHKGKYTQRLFEPQWVLLPFHWFLRDSKKHHINLTQLDVIAFVDESVNILNETYNTEVSRIEVSHLEKGYEKIIEENTLFKTVLEIDEDMFFEVYEKLNKMKKKEQKIEDVKLQVLNLYTSSKNILNSNVLNVASYLNSIHKMPKIQKG